MYYQNYEDYMRSVLGYPMTNELYANQTFQNCVCQNSRELEEMYPEIYRILNPIVCDVCNKCNRQQVNKDVLESMVNEVSQRIELNNEISIKINIDNRTAEKEVVDNRASKINSYKSAVDEQSRKVQETQNRQRRPQNPLLNDLIRILLLNQLLGGGFPTRPPRPPRPPFPGEPGRPPFPGNPGMPPRPREYNEYF